MDRVVHHRVPRLLAVLTAVAVFLPTTVDANPKRLNKALASAEAGKYQEAIDTIEPVAEGKYNFDAMMLLARLRHTVGDYEASELWVKRALAKARTDAQTAEAVTFRGFVHETVGDYDAARRSYSRVIEEFPDYRLARLRQGELLFHLGQDSEGSRLLDQFADEYNSGKARTAEELTMVGIAVRRLEYYEDANDVLGEATELDKTHAPAYVAWGALFWEKYNAEDARYAFSRALKLNPSLPEALVGLARIEFESAGNHDRAEALVERALAVNKRHTGALLLSAELAIDDENFGDAMRSLGRAIRVNPNDLDVLTLMATVYYLQDDTRQFARMKKRVFTINNRRASFYSTVARFAVRFHRYEEAIDLHNKALKVDPSYWRAFVGLGIGYTRIGDDRRGFEYLKKAHQNDPFNVRAFNMVNLYEKTIPKYEYVQHGPLRFRFHKAERAVLNRSVPPLARRAYDRFKSRYRFTPRTPVDVEIFRSTESFSVRSVGLPSISPHGICFGRVVTARSPSVGNFNWAEVIWHELAHVFHIQLSNSRVPRWFTEGLAEWESAQANNAWQREQDLAVVAAIREKRLPSVSSLTRQFTRAESLGEVVTAYYQSYLVISFIAEKFGEPSLVQALRLYGRSQTTPEVLQKITRMTVSEFDGAFLTWLKARYRTLLTTFEPNLRRYRDLNQYRAAAKKKPKSARAHAELAAALYIGRQIDRAEASFRKALSLDDKDPLANYLAAIYAVRVRKYNIAHNHLSTTLGAGHDGYSLRLQMGQVHLARGDYESAVLHFLRAADLYPRGVEAHRALAEVRLKAGDKQRAAEHLSVVVQLDQEDPAVALKLMRLYAEAGNLKDAVAAGRQAIDVRPFDPAVNLAVGEVAFDAADVELAELCGENAAALEAGAKERASAFLLLARVRHLKGDLKGARSALDAASKADGDHPGLEEVKRLVLQN